MKSWWSGCAVAVTAVCTLLAIPASLSRAADSSAAEAASADDAGPHELMTGLSNRLFAALDRDRDRIRRQPELALPLVDELLAPHFDAEYTARLVLGAHWRTATPEQRQRFVSALYRTLLWTYAGSVAEWAPDRLRILPLRADPAAPQAVVRTEVAQPGAAAVAVDYRLHRTADGWKIFDVIVDGVSYVRTYHDDIDGEIEQTGLDAATVRLEKRRNGAVVAAHRKPEKS